MFFEKSRFGIKKFILAGLEAILGRLGAILVSPSPSAGLGVNQFFAGLFAFGNQQFGSKLLQSVLE